MAERFVLLPEWDDWRGPGKEPHYVGPFDLRQEADEWARLNIPNGSWTVAPLTDPYLRSRSSDRRWRLRAPVCSEPSQGGSEHA